MDKIQALHISNPVPPSPRKAASPCEQIRRELPVSMTGVGLQISAEAQYLFEMDKYLSGIGQVDRAKVLDFLANSENPLLKSVPDYFRNSREMLDQSLGKDGTLILDRIGSEKARKLLDVPFALNGSTEIAVLPMAAKVFRLDGSDNFYPVKLSSRNDAANSRLDALEATAAGEIGNQDAANLFGSVRNALSASESILVSFDDVLHFTYSIEKARTAIASIAAPASIKSDLANLLDQGLDYQNNKQTKFLADVSGLTANNRVGDIASEDFRLGAAAQKFNGQLKAYLAATGLSVLSARSSVEQLLSQNTDLVRFGPDKLEEAFKFYEDDFSNFKRVLAKDFSAPQERQSFKIDGAVLEVGQAFARAVIGKINHYLHG